MGNLLHDLHRQAEAEFQPYGDIEIVSTFGEPQLEYAAFRRSAALVDLPQRGFLELTGRDRLQFLNNLVSADVWDKKTRQPLAAGRWVYAFFLNLRGRIVADMNVLEFGDRTLLELDRRLVAPLHETFEAYHFAEQVKMVNRCDDLHQIVMYGPQSVGLANEVVESATYSGQPQSCAAVKMLGHDIVAWRDDPTGPVGVHLIVPADAARAVWMHLLTRFGPSREKSRLRPAGWASFNAARIEAGRPILAIDIEPMPLSTAMPSKARRDQPEAPDTGPGMLPAETGQMDRAVSLSKCYIGQEIIARMHARGQVARKIVGIRMDGDALPIAGTQVLDEEGNTVGVITSSTNSPLLSNAAIGLAIVKRPLFEPGTSLRVPAEGQIRSATVVPTPFVKFD